MQRNYFPLRVDDSPPLTSSSFQDLLLPVLRLLRLLSRPFRVSIDAISDSPPTRRRCTDGRAPTAPLSTSAPSFITAAITRLICV